MMRQFTNAMGITAILASGGLAQTVNFGNLPAGAPPPGWTATKTGTGNPKWKVEKVRTRWASGRRPAA